MPGEKILEAIKRKMPDREDVEQFVRKAAEKKDDLLEWAGDPGSRITWIVNRVRKQKTEDEQKKRSKPQ